MTPENRRERVELLLPLAVGSTVTVLGWALSGWFVSVVGVVALLALGALVPGRSWLTGALAAAPGVFASLVRAAGESLGAVAVVVLLSPFVVAFCALVVKGGSLLVDRRREGAVAAESEYGSRRRWKPFETKAQRGRFLVFVAVLVVVGGGLLSRCGDEEADRAATRRADEIRAALEGRSLESIQMSLAREPDLPGAPYRFAAIVGDSFEATAEVQRGLQFRCILVHLGPDGRVSTVIRGKRCGG